jgi:hypothetical protein
MPAVYIFVSHRLFELTNTLKNVAVPHSNNQLLLRNCLLMGAAGLLVYLTTYGAFHLFLKQVGRTMHPEVHGPWWYSWALCCGRCNQYFSA